MAFEIRYSRLAHSQLKGIRAFDRTAILNQIDSVLTAAPTLTSKARVKLLRQPAPTDYRLKVGDFRVFYNVTDDDTVVQVIQVLTKSEALLYCQEQNDDSPDGDESDDTNR